MLYFKFLMLVFPDFIV